MKYTKLFIMFCVALQVFAQEKPRLVIVPFSVMDNESSPSFIEMLADDTELNNVFTTVPQSDVTTALNNDPSLRA